MEKILMPTIMLDGERFGLTIPTVKQWRYIQKAIENNIIPHTFFSGRLACFLYDFTEEGLAFYSSNRIDEKPMAVERNSEMKTLKLLSECVYGWRPVLIPLTKEQDIDDSFGWDNQEWTTMTGGCLYYERKYMGATRATDDEVFVEATSKSRICDQINRLIKTDCPLEWVVVQGVLVCKQNVGTAPIIELFKSYLIPSTKNCRPG